MTAVFGCGKIKGLVGPCKTASPGEMTIDTNASNNAHKPLNRPLRADEWRPPFLEALRETGNVSHAARVAGISRKSAYRARENSSEFAEDWEDALGEATDALEAEARRRAFEGVRRLQTYRGEVVMVPVLDEQGRPVEGEEDRALFEIDYSDHLLTFLLKAHRYKDRLDLTSGDEPIQHQPPITYIVENRSDASDPSDA